MKKFVRNAIIASSMIISGIASASAQYVEIANQLSNLISPALSGSFRYKGFVEASGLAGLGDVKANFLGVSTTQGFQYTDWLFMGAGMGVDVAMAKSDMDYSGSTSDWYSHSLTKTKVMIPVFTDFRFNIGPKNSTSFFIDLKTGAAWLLGSSYLQMDGGYMGTSTQFYLRPSVGVRFPVSKANERQAFNLSLTYQLLTSNNSYGWNQGSATLNNLGLTLSYEW